MRKFRVQYDAYNRQFMLLDHFIQTLRDGEIYLIVDHSLSHVDCDSDSLCDDQLGTLACASAD